MNQLLKTYEEKILKMQVDPNSKALLAEISKIKITLELLGIEVPDIGNIPEIQSITIANHIPQMEEKVNELKIERDKLQSMLTRHDSPELRQKVEELNEQIHSLQQPVAQITDEIKQYYSHILNEKFTWNLTQGIIVFESGAKYTEAEVCELLRLGGGGPGAIKLTHDIKSKFNAVMKSFKPIYEVGA
jgi:hypothetical protein